MMDDHHQGCPSDFGWILLLGRTYDDDRYYLLCPIPCLVLTIDILRPALLHYYLQVHTSFRLI